MCNNLDAHTMKLPEHYYTIYIISTYTLHANVAELPCKRYIYLVKTRVDVYEVVDTKEASRHFFHKMEQMEVWG